MSPAIFLDRDGVIIEDTGYINEAETIEFVAGAIDGLSWLHSTGHPLVIITNQSGIGRGLISHDQYEQVHETMLAQLTAAHIPIAGVYRCPHIPDDDCECRKPKPGMLRQAARELDLDLARSWMIGDRDSDIEAGRAAGCRTVQFTRASSLADFAFPDWPALVNGLAGVI